MTRLESNLLRDVGRAVHEYGLIEGGDRVMVAVSGGKDSYAMLQLLRRLQERAPVKFSLVAVNLDQGHPGFPGHLLEGFLKDQGYEYRMLKRDTYSVVLEKVPEGLAARITQALMTPRSSSAAPRSRSATTATTSSRR